MKCYKYLLLFCLVLLFAGVKLRRINKRGKKLIIIN